MCQKEKTTFSHQKAIPLIEVKFKKKKNKKNPNKETQQQQQKPCSLQSCEFSRFLSWLQCRWRAGYFDSLRMGFCLQFSDTIQWQEVNVRIVGLFVYFNIYCNKMIPFVDS